MFTSASVIYIPASVANLFMAQVSLALGDPLVAQFFPFNPHYLYLQV